MNKYLICLMILCFCGSAAARDLKAEMPPEAFSAAGLDKLSPAELAALNAWLAQGNATAAPATTSAAAPSASSATAAAAAVEDRRGLPAPEATDKSAIESRIKGTFRGWSGSTRFELENGQVWVQSNPGESFNSTERESPSVTIRPAFMGSWILKVEGANSSARVKRIQ
jgi:hypothetical protein